MAEITLEDEIEAVRAIVDRTERFCMRHPRRPDAPPVPDTAERELAAMKAVLARLEASRWRPIAEAIAEAESNDGWISARPFAIEREWGWEMWIGQCDAGDIWLGRTDDGSCFDTDKPTHYMTALPSPPSTTSEGSAGA